MLTVEQFKEGLTDSQRQTIEQFIDDQAMPQFTSWEQVVTTFAKPNDRQAWRVYSRVLESLHPEQITQDQLSLLFVWERAFAAAKVDLYGGPDPIVTKRDKFHATKDKESLSKFIDNLINFARSERVTLPKRADEVTAEVTQAELTLGDEEPF